MNSNSQRDLTSHVFFYEQFFIFCSQKSGKKTFFSNLSTNCWEVVAETRLWLNTGIIYMHSPATLLGTPVQLLGNTNC